MLLLVNCARSSPTAPAGSLKETGECHAYARLRPRSFEHDAVEDFDLVEMVALGFKELPPLLDGGFHNWVVIATRTESPAGSA